MKESAVTTEALLEIMNNQLDLIDEKDKKIADLQQRLDYMLRQKFASSSEKFPSNQPSLFEDTTSNIEIVEEKETENISYTRKKRGSRTTPPESLPHVRVEHDMSEEEKVCSCGCGMKRIKEIVSHQYDIIPASFRVIDNVRFIYACTDKCGEAVKTSSLTPQVLPRHQVTPSFLATIAVQKFEDALPLERQVKIYRNRFGVNFTTTTFSNWMTRYPLRVLKPLS